ncbi:polyphosphate kinase 2 [Candidatus Magnetaquicoccus inordinatus]|uniref:polyphosphate kinase 2 n=1 Tax=Candidatus Magnetaquicoccus inordinatus TaxID=2496818 RepID=UPI00102AF794|nr:polyphosphate kinase 2 [Candidatus Magnetaquicoccus inordinatus]
MSNNNKNSNTPEPGKEEKKPIEEVIRGREKEVIRLLREQDYLNILTPLQQELVKLQQWVVANKLKIVILFEGRDAAGKGGTIKRFMEFLSPRVCRIVALEKPTDQERTQWYFQRYIKQLPHGGEIIFFDRSWYNRPGVETVMGFCTPEQTETFYRQLPKVEEMFIESGINLIKFWFSVDRSSQEERFASRETNPLKVWKLSPVDKEAQAKWDDYSKARDVMLKKTNLKYAPWTVVRSDDKKLARINAIRYVLSRFDYDGKNNSLLKVDPRIIVPVSEEIGRS